MVPQQLPAAPAVGVSSVGVSRNPLTESVEDALPPEMRLLGWVMFLSETCILGLFDKF